MPFGPGLQPGEPPLLNRPTVARRPDRSCGLVVDPSPMDVRWSRRRDSNPEPAVYKTAALPIELRRRDGQGHTAEDPIRRRQMIGRTRRMGQARSASGRGTSASTEPETRCPARYDLAVSALVDFAERAGLR